MGVSNYFCIDKAKRELGYRPRKQNDITDVLDDFIKRGFRKDTRKTSPFIRIIALSVIFTCIFISFFSTWDSLGIEKATIGVILDKISQWYRHLRCYPGVFILKFIRHFIWPSLHQHAKEFQYVEYTFYQF